MLDLIREYISADFVPGAYREVLWFMAWILLATLVTGVILSLWTWWRDRRYKAYPADAKLVLHPTNRISLRHLMSWHPAALLVLTAMSAGSLWMGWHIVILPLAAATAVSYLWHFHLRRSGVRWAATYSMASWVMPYLVVIATIILFRPIELQSVATVSGVGQPDELTFGFHWWGNRVGWPHAWVYPRLNGLDPTILTGIALWSISAVTASLAMTPFRRLPFNPMLVVALASPVALTHWFTNPWAIPLGAFTMVLLGHAMSRERRLRVGAMRLLEGEREGTFPHRWSDMRAVTRKLLPIGMMIALAAVTAVIVPDWHEIYYWFLNQSWTEDWPGFLYDVLITASLWVPFVALGAVGNAVYGLAARPSAFAYLGIGAVGYTVWRRVASPAEVTPFAATAVLLAVLLDALTSGHRWFDELSWFHLKWPPPLINHHPYGPRLIFPDVHGVPLGLSYVVAIVLLFATVWQVVRGTLANYGGMLCGMAWIVVVYWVFDISLSLRPVWTAHKTDLLLANLTIAAIAMFALLYWGFGPGSIRTNPRQPRPRWRATAGEVR